MGIEVSIQGCIGLGKLEINWNELQNVKRMMPAMKRLKYEEKRNFSNTIIRLVAAFIQIKIKLSSIPEIRRIEESMNNPNRQMHSLSLSLPLD